MTRPAGHKRGVHPANRAGGHNVQLGLTVTKQVVNARTSALNVATTRSSL